ncbi:hypothetical protein Avbf_15012, partial [Armadillidium vulgare]
GYTGDGFFCKSLKSCLQDPSICHPDAMCQRSSTDEYHHECVCLPGFTGDGSTCEKNPEHEKNIIFVNQGLSVLRMPIDPNVGNGYPIHVDPYMTAEYRTPEDVAVDWFLETFTGLIHRVTLFGFRTLKQHWFELSSKGI